MKEALLFNECFGQSVVESEAASLSTQPEQFDHAGTQIELCPIATLQWLAAFLYQGCLLWPSL